MKTTAPLLAVLCGFLVSEFSHQVYAENSEAAETNIVGLRHRRAVGGKPVDPAGGVATGGLGDVLKPVYTEQPGPVTPRPKPKDKKPKPKKGGKKSGKRPKPGKRPKKSKGPQKAKKAKGPKKSKKNGGSKKAKKTAKKP